MSLPFFWIDAFTRQPFSGNPAGVVLLERWLPDDMMQHAAFEHGFAETAFLVRTGDARYHLRWFTPAVEVELCGHATLAAGHVILEEVGTSGHTVTFDTLSGPLTVTRIADGKLQLDFPSTPPEPAADPVGGSAITTALGIRGVQWIGRSRFDWFVVLYDANAIRALRPDMTRVAALGARGVIVTAAGDDVDFVSRFFAPQSGVPEDPVTGSAHCALTPYWAGKLQRTALHARQLSARGGELWCEVVDAGESQRVRIAGYARRYLHGTINL
jgi:PhzF family phenazine biosynthesis protein